MNDKRAKAIDIAFSIIDDGETELTYTEAAQMSDADLFEWLEKARGMGWTGGEWVQAKTE